MNEHKTVKNRYGRFPSVRTSRPDRSLHKRNVPIFYTFDVSSIARAIFGVIIFQDFAGPSNQNGAFDLQTGRSGRPHSYDFSMGACSPVSGDLGI